MHCVCPISHPMYQLLPIPPRASSSAVGECKFLVNSSTAFNCLLLLLCCSPLPPGVTTLVSYIGAHHSNAASDRQIILETMMPATLCKVGCLISKRWDGSECGYLFIFVSWHSLRLHTPGISSYQLTSRTVTCIVQCCEQIDNSRH